MAQSYKKGRKFKTESPALLPITCGDRPAAASRTPVSIPPLYSRRRTLSAPRKSGGGLSPIKIGVVEILLKNRAPRGWNPANNS